MMNEKDSCRADHLMTHGENSVTESTDCSPHSLARARTVCTPQMFRKQRKAKHNGKEEKNSVGYSMDRLPD